MTEKGKHMYKAAIFDMDGTLYDTEKLYRSGWLYAGVPLELYHSFIGTTNPYIFQTLTDHGLDAARVIETKIEYVNRELEKGIPLKEGAVEALRWLKENGWKNAIATSSAMDVADRYLDSTGMREYFDEVVSGYNLEHGKPEPDIFLLAARQLGMDPSECIVVEDSFNGVRAGRAAGMFTVMVPDLIEPDEEMRSLADLILTSLRELPDHL